MDTILDVAEDEYIIDEYIPDDSLGIKSNSNNIIYYEGQDTIQNLFYKKLNYIPNRSYYCGDDDILSNLLVNCIYFMPNDIIDMMGKDGKYIMVIYGCLLNGIKTELTITGIDIFFDVLVPNNLSTKTFEAQLNSLLMMEVSDSKIIDIEAFPIRGYNENKVAYKRIYNKNLQSRKKALNIILNAGFQTASDDRNNYYRKVARENELLLSDWMAISNLVNISSKNKPNSNYYDFSNKNLYKLSANIENIKSIDAETKQSNKLFIKDKTLVMTWDIETYSERNMGDLPLADYDEDNAFMICMTFHWKDNISPLLQICITHLETESDDRWITIVCKGDSEKNEQFKNIIKAFALCFEMLRPDLLYGFNDGEYDWPFIIKKAKKFLILEWMWNKMSISRYTALEFINSFYIMKNSIKITADSTAFSNYLKIVGCICIDVRTCFRKLYTKAEKTSLKYFLEICKLGGKADMPMKKMWTFYKSALAKTTALAETTAALAKISPKEGMRHIAHYCIIDAFRCQELMIKRGQINDLREVASLAYMSLFDSHYYAGGKKVCNLLGAYANRKGILISMIPKPNLEKGKYPGAFVFSPYKGLTPNPIKLSKIEELGKQYRAAIEMNADLIDIKKNIKEALEDFTPDRPTVGLDFSSLYPSLIMTYNLSPEKIILNYEEAMMYKERGYSIYNIDFMYGDRQVTGWSILHNNNEADIGLYPSVLIDLFNKRAEMKKILAKYKSIIEVMDGIYGHAKKIEKSSSNLKEAIWEIKAESINELAKLQNEKIVVSVGGTLEEEIEDNKRKMKIIKERLSVLEDLLNLDCDISDNLITTDTFIEKYKQYYDSAVFECTCANVKQNAIKIYMNTFYGEAGNSLSPFFLLELAGAVTSSGQYNIKLVAKFVQSKGFHIKYGDTDSLYLVPPPIYFSECDMQFIEGKLTREEYWTAMVRITMRVMNSLKTEVNDYLYKDNGSKYLKMAYEEVLYPVVFTGKKKYYGIAHENEINFRPNHLFIRGIDIIKQGQSGLAKTIGNRIMWESMSINNNKTVREIVEHVITDAVINKNQWEFDNFIKSDAWRPNKQNISVHIFMRRMKIYADIENQENQKKIELGINTVKTLYELPEAGERFNYVIVKKDSISDMFDIHGRKIAIKKGDRMEFVSVAKDKNLPIDIVFYMINYVVGICARFINYDNEFQLNADQHNNSQTDDDQHDIEKKIDEHSQKMAKKYLENLIKQLENIDSSVIRQQGNLYKKVYSSVIKRSKEQLSPLISNLFHGKIINYEIFINNTDTLYDTVCGNMTQFIEKNYTIKTKKFCDCLVYNLNIINDGNINSVELYKWHPFIGRIINTNSNNISSSIFNSIVDGLNIIAIKYENVLTEQINNDRLQLNSETSLNFMELITEKEYLIIQTFIEHLLNIYGNLKYKFKKNMLAKHLNLLKATLLNTTIKPSNIEKNKAIKESANKFYPICGNVEI